uniref:Uncharacterized protein n=1 Tax=viral metagenome TaxID=1070528 RepID=A0A6M3KIT6_9ZZZZ
MLLLKIALRVIVPTKERLPDKAFAISLNPEVEPEKERLPEAARLKYTFLLTAPVIAILTARYDGKLIGPLNLIVCCHHEGVNDGPVKESI